MSNMSLHNADQLFNTMENAICHLVDETKDGELCHYTLTDQCPHMGSLWHQWSLPAVRSIRPVKFTKDTGSAI